MQDGDQLWATRGFGQYEFKIGYLFLGTFECKDRKAKKNSAITASIMLYVRSKTKDSMYGSKVAWFLVVVVGHHRLVSNLLSNSS
jgi:hypothetical protein